MRKALIAVAMTTALAACGGGGGGSSTVTPSAPGTSPVVGGGGSTSSIATTTLKLKLYASAAMSSMARSPKFVSSSTNGVLVNVYSHADSAHATVIGTSSTDVSPGSAACGGATGTRVCTIVVPSPAGVDDFVFVTYDAAPVGTSFATAHQLGTGTVSGQTIAANSANTVNVAIGGAVASITSFPPDITFLPDGNVHNALLTITAKDADGNIIIAGPQDPYVNTIFGAVSETNNSGPQHAAISRSFQSTFFGSSFVSIATSNDQAYVVYDGRGGPGYVATAKFSDPANAVSPAPTLATTILTPMYVTSTSPYLNPGFPPTLNFTGSGQSAAMTLYEGGTHFPTADGSNCAGIATISAPPASPSVDPTLGNSWGFTITSAGTGTCTMYVVDYVVRYPITVNVSAGTPTTTTTIGIPAANPVATTIPIPTSYGTSSNLSPVSFSLPTFGAYTTTLNLNTNQATSTSFGPSPHLFVQLNDSPTGGAQVLQGAGVHSVLLYGSMQPVDFGYSDGNGVADNIVFTVTTAPSGTYHLAVSAAGNGYQNWILDPFGPGVVSGNTITFTKPMPVFTNGGNGFYLNPSITGSFALYQ